MPSQRSSIVSGVGWKLAERTLAQIIAFVVSIVLARILSPSDYGLVAMVVVFTAIANVFVVSGFSASLIQDKNAGSTDFSTIFFCSLSVSLILYVALFFCAPFIAEIYGRSELTDIVRVYSLMLPMSALNSVQSAYVSRHMIFKKFFFATLWGTLASGAIGIAMALMGFGVWALVAQGLSSLLVNSITLLVILPWRPAMVFSRKSAISHMGYGWKILAADLMGAICDNLRPLILGKFYSANDLAQFNRGQSFPDLVSNNIQTTLSSVLFPAMSNVSDDAGEVRSLLQRAVQVISYVMFPFFVWLIVVAAPLVDVLLTDKWAECVAFLQLVAFTRLIEVVSGQNLQALKAVGRSDIVLRLEFIKKPVFIASLVYASTISVFAIAVTWPIYALFAALVNIWPNRKLIDYGIMKQLRDISAPLFLSCAMAVAMSFCSLVQMPSILTLLVETVVGFGLYFGLSAVFNFGSFAFLKALALETMRKRVRV